MNEKKKHILESAMKLFSEKGLHSTTIQEIAQKSGVSKGGFYLHFHSKEDLILSIYQYFYQSYMDQMTQIRREAEDPRISLEKQVEMILNSVLENKEFILMQMRYSISLGEEVDNFIQYMKQENFKWSSENLLNIYGDSLKPFLVDANSLFEGIISGYLKWFILEGFEVETTRLAQYMTRRIDNCITGMLREEEEPQIAYEEIMKHFPEGNRMESSGLKESLQNLKEQIDQLTIGEEQRKDLHVAIDVLIEEEKKEAPQAVIFQGMLTPFQEIPEMKQDCETILKMVNKDLFIHK